MSKFDHLNRLIYVYLLRKGSIKKAWKTPGKVNKKRCLSDKLELGYFLDFSEDASYSGPLTPEGNPLIDYGGKIGKQLNPWFIGHYALANFEKFIQYNNLKNLEEFKKQADWFAKNAKLKNNGKFVVWEYLFDWKPLKAPWISSLSQSYAISTLLRAHIITNNDDYLELAKKAFVCLTTPISEGGVLGQRGKLLTFEEVPKHPINTVLNGFIFSLWGILEYAHYTQSKEAFSIYNEGLYSLKKLLSEYELGFWSKYSLETGEVIPPIASLFYHQVHISQLKAMYLITGDEIFNKFAHRWENYTKSFFKKAMAFLIKATYKIIYV